MIDMSWLLKLPPSRQQELLEGPALKPPAPNIRPNFDDPPNYNSLGWGTFTTLPALAAILVAVQLYSRIVYHKKFAVEDGLTVAALGAFTAFVYFIWRVFLNTGIFVHQWNVKLKDVPDVLYNISAGSTVYGQVIMFLKAAILVHWSRMFVPTGNRNAFWWTCQITLWVNVLFYVICTFIELFGCSPRRKLWTPWVEGHCLDMPKVIIASSFINFLSDVVILLLPQAVIWRLRMSRTKRAGAAALFAMGVFATVCAGFRIKATFVFAEEADITYNVAPLGLWCLGEMVAGFFVVCLPAMPKLFKASPLIRSIMSTLRTSSKRSGSDRSKRSLRTWPRPLARRDPDASLFSDVDTKLSKGDFVPLTNVGETSSVEERKETLRGV